MERTRNPAGAASSYDLTFHATFLASLQKAQFQGKAPFLFDAQHKDRDIFNALTDNFYLHQKDIDENQNKIEAELLPLFLLSYPGALDIKANSTDLLTRYKKSFDDAIIQDRKKQIGRGGEGTSPDIHFDPIQTERTIPFLEFQPNIEFDPITRIPKATTPEKNQLEILNGE